MNRRHFVLTGIASGLAVATLSRPALASFGQMEVFKSPTCGCCAAWVDHMTRAGFEAVARDVDQETLWTMKDRAGVTPELSSCHTAFIDGYFIEGHVPASDVQRLLSERPDALGLTVPGMPIGSPGMEMGNQRDAYDTLLVLRDGSTEVFESHA
ncbi:DUF411 domain-containing protein [Cognatishimia sp. F0-27]|uniref:DUF411 domain-containing protein n=1 Tax=Cognatishimia sp. F0-27 TaxID=2816855 RepID=UPI001D0C781D|nr:DUF411 domain-containing protein [Cognatishimia sp. F0-27]MCC1492817.1 DUF411 domain-containing protein [Cognatishimia sp. F0-27]